MAETLLEDFELVGSFKAGKNYSNVTNSASDKTEGNYSLSIGGSYYDMSAYRIYDSPKSLTSNNLKLDVRTNAINSTVVVDFGFDYKFKTSSFSASTAQYNNAAIVITDNYVYEITANNYNSYAPAKIIKFTKDGKIVAEKTTEFPSAGGMVRRAVHYNGYIYSILYQASPAGYYIVKINADTLEYTKLQIDIDFVSSDSHAAILEHGGYIYFTPLKYGQIARIDANSFDNIEYIDYTSNHEYATDIVFVSNNMIYITGNRIARIYKVDITDISNPVTTEIMLSDAVDKLAYDGNRYIVLLDKYPYSSLDKAYLFLLDTTNDSFEKIIFSDPGISGSSRNMYLLYHNDYFYFEINRFFRFSTLTKTASYLENINLFASDAVAENNNLYLAKSGFTIFDLTLMDAGNLFGAENVKTIFPGLANTAAVVQDENYIYAIHHTKPLKISVLSKSTLSVEEYVYDDEAYGAGLLIDGNYLYALASFKDAFKVMKIPIGSLGSVYYESTILQYLSRRNYSYSDAISNKIIAQDSGYIYLYYIHTDNTFFIYKINKSDLSYEKRNFQLSVYKIGIDVDNNYIYYIDNNNLYRLDKTNFSTATPENLYLGSVSSYAVKVAGNNIYVFCGNSIKIVDSATFSVSDTIGTIDLFYSDSGKYYLYNNQYLVGKKGPYIYSIDILNPGDGMRLKQIGGPSVNDFIIDETRNIAYMFANSTLYLVDLTSFYNNPYDDIYDVKAAQTSINYATVAATDGDYIYIGRDSNYGLAKFDSNFTLTHTLSFNGLDYSPTYVRHIIVDDTYVYAVCATNPATLVIANKSDLSSPSVQQLSGYYVGNYYYWQNTILQDTNYIYISMVRSSGSQIVLCRIDKSTYQVEEAGNSWSTLGSTIKLIENGNYIYMFQGMHVFRFDKTDWTSDPVDFSLSITVQQAEKISDSYVAIIYRSTSHNNYTAIDFYDFATFTGVFRQNNFEVYSSGWYIPYSLVFDSDTNNLYMVNNYNNIYAINVDVNNPAQTVNYTTKSISTGLSWTSSLNNSNQYKNTFLMFKGFVLGITGSYRSYLYASKAQDYIISTYGKDETNAAGFPLTQVVQDSDYAYFTLYKSDGKYVVRYHKTNRTFEYKLLTNESNFRPTGLEIDSQYLYILIKDSAGTGCSVERILISDFNTSTSLHIDELVENMTSDDNYLYITQTDKVLRVHKSDFSTIDEVSLEGNNSNIIYYNNNLYINNDNKVVQLSTVDFATMNNWDPLPPDRHIDDLFVRNNELWIHSNYYYLASDNEYRFYITDLSNFGITAAAISRNVFRDDLNLKIIFQDDDYIMFSYDIYGLSARSGYAFRIGLLSDIRQNISRCIKNYYSQFPKAGDYYNSNTIGYHAVKDGNTIYVPSITLYNSAHPDNSLLVMFEYNYNKFDTAFPKKERTIYQKKSIAEISPAVQFYNDEYIIHGSAPAIYRAYSSGADKEVIDLSNDYTAIRSLVPDDSYFYFIAQKKEDSSICAVKLDKTSYSKQEYTLNVTTSTFNGTYVLNGYLKNGYYYPVFNQCDSSINRKIFKVNIDFSSQESIDLSAADVMSVLYLNNYIVTIQVGPKISIIDYDLNLIRELELTNCASSYAYIYVSPDESHVIIKAGQSVYILPTEELINGNIDNVSDLRYWENIAFYSQQALAIDSDGTAWVSYYYNGKMGWRNAYIPSEGMTLEISRNDFYNRMSSTYMYPYTLEISGDLLIADYKTSTSYTRAIANKNSIASSQAVYFYHRINIYQEPYVFSIGRDPFRNYVVKASNTGYDVDYSRENELSYIPVQTTSYMYDDTYVYFINKRYMSKIALDELFDTTNQITRGSYIPGGRISIIESTDNYIYTVGPYYLAQFDKNNLQLVHLEKFSSYSYYTDILADESNNYIYCVYNNTLVRYNLSDWSLENLTLSHYYRKMAQDDDYIYLVSYSSPTYIVRVNKTSFVEDTTITLVNNSSNQTTSLNPSFCKIYNNKLYTNKTSQIIELDLNNFVSESEYAFRCDSSFSTIMPQSENFHLLCNNGYDFGAMTYTPGYRTYYTTSTTNWETADINLTKNNFNVLYIANKGPADNSLLVDNLREVTATSAGLTPDNYLRYGKYFSDGILHPMRIYRP